MYLIGIVMRRHDIRSPWHATRVTAQEKACSPLATGSLCRLVRGAVVKRAVPLALHVRVLTDAAGQRPLLPHRGAALLNAAPPPEEVPEAEFSGPSPARITSPPGWSLPPATAGGFAVNPARGKGIATSDGGTPVKRSPSQGEVPHKVKLVWQYSSA